MKFYNLLYLSHLLLVVPCRSFLLSLKSNDLISRNTAFQLHYTSASSEDNQDIFQNTGNITTAASREIVLLQQQAEALRSEAESLRNSLEASKAEKLRKEKEKVDNWIEHLFVNITINDDTQLLNDVDKVMEMLKDERFSEEQVRKIFDRICETNGYQSRSRCSPLMSLLVDAAGKLDCLERDANPNKRWSGKVEREFRKRLFAQDFGIDLDVEDGVNIMEDPRRG